jgi:hypothetical protein
MYKLGVVGGDLIPTGCEIVPVTGIIGIYWYEHAPGMAFEPLQNFTFPMTAMTAIMTARQCDDDAPTVHNHLCFH